MSVKAIVEVQAGVIPGQPEEQYDKRWVITSQEWDTAMREGTQGTTLAEFAGRAQGYSMMLMLQPDRVNWVRTEWMWT